MKESQYLLFTEGDTYDTYDTYERLLSVLVPGIKYIDILANSIIKNAIVINSNLKDSEIILELKQVLQMVGYNGEFQLLKPVC